MQESKSQNVACDHPRYARIRGIPKRGTGLFNAGTNVPQPDYCTKCRKEVEPDNGGD